MPDDLKAKSGKNMERTQQSIELCFSNTVSKIYLSPYYIMQRVELRFLSADYYITDLFINQNLTETSTILPSLHIMSNSNCKWGHKKFDLGFIQKF